VLRGENGQSGDFNLFFNEVEDVLAASDLLARLPSVDSGKMLFVAGQSVGGTLAMLSAMTSPRFRAAASKSGSPDQINYVRGLPDIVPFDPADIREFRLRSPVPFATSLKCPARLYFGDDEIWLHGPTTLTATRAKAVKLDVEAVEIPGNHTSSFPMAIEFFRDR
jgi:dienelactone hydrolase